MTRIEVTGVESSDRRGDKHRRQIPTAVGVRRKSRKRNIEKRRGFDRTGRDQAWDWGEGKKRRWTNWNGKLQRRTPRREEETG